MANKKVDFNQIVGTASPVLVDFHATWCSPCKALAPVIKEVKKDVGDKMRIIKIDIDKNKALAHKYKVQSVPTLAIFKYGKIIWRESGMKTKGQLVKLIKQYS